MENGKQPINPIDGSHQGFHPKQLIGLTKREYFAGLAMQGIISTYRTVDPPPSHIAEMAIKYADELLKQLEK